MIYTILAISVIQSLALLIITKFVLNNFTLAIEGAKKEQEARDQKEEKLLKELEELRWFKDSVEYTVDSITLENINSNLEVKKTIKQRLQR